MAHPLTALQWTHWRELKTPSERRGSATYKIRLTAEGQAVHIPRFLGPDEDGLLCIGETSNMEKRRRNFARAVKRGRGHSSGNLLCQLELAGLLAPRWPGRIFEYSFAVAESKGDAIRLQDDLIEVYMRRFGEAPPLNSSIPRALRLHGFGFRAAQER